MHYRIIPFVVQISFAFPDDMELLPDVYFCGSSNTLFIDFLFVEISIIWTGWVI
jgi:hypothetical protein